VVFFDRMGKYATHHLYYQAFIASNAYLDE
jgi:hypothetical protein